MSDGSAMSFGGSDGFLAAWNLTGSAGATGSTGATGIMGTAGAYQNTGATIHVTTAGAYTNSPTFIVMGTASGLGFPGVDTYDNGVLDGGGGVYDGVWQSTLGLTPGDNVVTVGPELGSGAASVDRIDLVYEPGFANLLKVAIAQAGGNTNSAVQVLSGTATSTGFGARFTAGTALTLSDNGGVLGRATVGTDESWNAQVTLPVQGDDAITVSDLDLAGNSGEAVIHFGLKTSTPAVAIASAGGAVSDALQVISGTASAGAGAGPGSNVVTVSEDGAAIGSAIVGTDGTWSLVTTLGGGSHVFQATDADGYGNVGVSNAVAYALSTPPATAPAPSVTIASGGGLTDQAAATVGGQATANSTVTLYDNGGAVASTSAGADGSWALALTLGQGVNILSATDATEAGTAGGTAISDILDTTPPAVGFGASPRLSGSVATLSGTASDASGIAGVEIFQGATALGAAQVDGDGSWTFTHDFGQGSYDQLTAVATDAAGNGASASAPYDLVTGSPGVHSSGAITVKDASGAVTSVTTSAADGSIGARTVSNGDGTATGTGYENGQALFSIGNDVMTGNGYREDFVFGPTMGHARVTDFVVAGGGHDTITLSRQDFATVAQVLNQTTMDHGSAVIHVSPGETIRLAGVTKAQLVQHRGDFAFTS